MHTPGPWMSGGNVVWKVDGDMIADLTCEAREHSFETIQDNASLIAAAPDLLATMPVPDAQGVRFGPHCWLSYDALVGWHGEDGPARDHHYSTSIVARKLMEWVESARAAIAKTGRK